MKNFIVGLREGKSLKLAAESFVQSGSGVVFYIGENHTATFADGVVAYVYEDTVEQIEEEVEETGEDDETQPEE